jgi:adenylosuccinate synthase
MSIYLAYILLIYSPKSNTNTEILIFSDEGKGKLVDILCPTVNLCARAQGGNNAGHTIVVGSGADKITYDFHLLPSGLINPECMNLIGSGVVVHVPAFFKELNDLEAKGLKNVRKRILISDRCQVVLDLHQKLDGLEEVELGKKSIGTTGKGIGQSNTSLEIRNISGLDTLPRTDFHCGIC